MYGTFINTQYFCFIPNSAFKVKLSFSSHDEDNKSGIFFPSQLDLFGIFLWAICLQGLLDIFV